MVDSIGFTSWQKLIKWPGATQGPAQTKSTPTVDWSNIFSGHLVGINSNIKIGDYQYGQIQAGRKLGGTTLSVG